MIVQREEVEQELTNQLEKTESERRRLLDELSANQRQLSSLQLEKHDVEKSASRLEKDKIALIKTLDKVQKTCNISETVQDRTKVTMMD